MEILADGTWQHEGTRITRESLVRLFASILRKDADGETYLVTPGGEDPRARRGRAVRRRPRRPRTARARPDHRLHHQCRRRRRRGPRSSAARDYAASGEPRPYVLVRGRLEARILRAPFYELVEWGEERDGQLGVWSGGVWWELGAG